MLIEKIASESCSAIVLDNAVDHGGEKALGIAIGLGCSAWNMLGWSEVIWL